MDDSQTIFAFKTFRIACCFALPILSASNAQAQQGERPDTVAIDVLVEPDATMIDKARAVNALLRQNYPEGYPLDAAHVPHITLVQRYVRAGDLEAITGAVASAVQSGPALPIRLMAIAYVSEERPGTDVIAYRVKHSPDLLQLANKIEEAVRPFAVSGGTADAFVKAPGEQISADTIKYVENFVPASSGKRYVPHITLGIAHQYFVHALKIAPFDRFDFYGVNLAIYQLGNFGTAQKRIWSGRQQ